MANSPDRGTIPVTSPPSISPSTFSSTRFDYLIVGGGTAALVIAARLSAIPSISVGVLEAGPSCFDEPSVKVPGRFGESLGSRLDWQFETVPQSNLGGRRLQWPRGRALGGTSALNFMTWTRGNREDFDAWKELGNEGWGWDDLQPYFKKTETLHQSDPSHQQQHQSYSEAADHGTDGPITTIYSKEYSVPHQYWHPTLKKLGLETNKRHFSGSNLGAFTTLTSVDPKTRTRASSATAYYLPNASRTNLHVLTGATVEKIELESRGDELVATGVTYLCGAECYIARSESEVIVCAGTIQSPQLLELSGVGDPDVLKAAGIPVKVRNYNVGENLQEHMMTAMIYEVDPTLTGPDELRANPLLAEAAQKVYETSQSGIYAMLPCALSYASLPQVVPPPKLWPIISSLPPANGLRDEVLHKQFNQPRRGQLEYLFELGNWSPYYESEQGKVYGTMLMMLQLPLTKGSIHIPTELGRTPTVHDKPVIHPKIFEDKGGEVDISIMAECQKFAAKICKTSPLSSIIRKRVYPVEEEETFPAWIKDSCMTDWHPIGTCAMGGRLGISVGVVDARLRVYGVKGLRVVDASVMPLHICSHPQATVYAIGEKGAAMILEDRGDHE